MTRTSEPTIEDLAARLAVLEAEAAERPPPSRRALLGLSAAAASIAVLSTPRPARADISPSDVFEKVRDAINDTITGPIRAINEILGTAFSAAVGLSIPTSFQDIIRCLLGPEGISFNFDGCKALQQFLGGPFQLLGTRRISPTIDEVWPDELPDYHPRTLDEATIMEWDATRAQVEAAQGVTASLAEAQALLGEIDTQTLAALHAAAADGYLFPLLAMQGQLTFSICERLGMVIQALNAQQQALSNQTLMEPHRRMIETRQRRVRSDPTRVEVGTARPIGSLR
jgi:hypothetical protein